MNVKHYLLDALLLRLVMKLQYSELLTLASVWIPLLFIEPALKFVNVLYQQQFHFLLKTFG